MSEKLDLRGDDTLPEGLKHSLRCLGRDTEQALSAYFAYQGRGDYTRLELNGGLGDISSNCDFAAKIAARFGLIVEFTFNEKIVRAHPDAASAARYDWARQQ